MEDRGFVSLALGFAAEIIEWLGHFPGGGDGFGCIGYVEMSKWVDFV